MLEGRLYVAPGTAAAPAARGLAWLWRLGPLLDAPDPSAVGVGTLDEAAELDALVRARRLAGSVVFAGQPGPAQGPVPERAAGAGRARFPSGSSLRGTFTLLGGGSPAMRSTLGVHAAVSDGRTLVVAADHEKGWTLLQDFWALDPLAAFLASTLERPLVLLPAVGVVRLDDAPGTAQHQVQDTDHADPRQVRRIKAMARAYARHGAVLNLAVAARALAEDRRTQVPLQDVWPRSVAAIADGIQAGTFEPVGHGYLHLDPDALARDEIEWREFARLDEPEAGRRLDAVLEWQEQVLGRRPGTFVAPAWAYSEGTRAAARARGLPAWLPPQLGPLVDGDDPRQSLDSALRTMDGLSYRPFVDLAELGVPPTPVLHGGLFDLRVEQLRAARDPVAFARLVLRRDLLRVPAVSGLRWIGAGEYVELLRAHETVEVRGAEVHAGQAPGARVRQVDATVRPASQA